MAEWSPVVGSAKAMRTSNPIRKIVDRRPKPRDETKKVIQMDIGDPTKYGNMDTDPFVQRTLAEAAATISHNGYQHSCGNPEARAAIAEYVPDPIQSLTADDVVITSGCSGALDIALNALLNPGDNVLLPTPGFSLYVTITESIGATPRFYNLAADRNWECDLEQLDSLFDDRTKAVLINNPSNPCGSVFRKDHIRDIVALCEKHRVPIIADEIYADMVFDNDKFTFHRVASLSPVVPVLSVGGIAKRFLVPGWRLGWITVHDRNGLFKEIRIALQNLSTLILGANAVTQATLPALLKDTPKEFFDNTMTTLRENSEFLYQRINKIDGLQCAVPQGAMYMMVGIDVSKFQGIEDDVDFFAALIEEEAVSVLPGEVFRMKNFVRLVTCPSREVLEEAVFRLEEFCKRRRQ